MTDLEDTLERNENLMAAGAQSLRAADAALENYRRLFEDAGVTEDEVLRYLESDRVPEAVRIEARARIAAMEKELRTLTAQSAGPAAATSGGGRLKLAGYV